MRRRQVVAALGLLAAGSAGCASTPSPEPQPPESTPAGDGGPTTPRAEMQVTDFETLEGPDGDLVVELTVRNPGSGTRETRVLVTAQAGDTTRSATRELTLGARESRDLSVTVPLSYADWDRTDSSLDFAFSEQ